MAGFSAKPAELKNIAKNKKYTKDLQYKLLVKTINFPDIRFKISD
jgi:transcriptional regulator of aromatic amino acid metabolism